MAVPKKRTSKRRKGMRRAHDFLRDNASTTECPEPDCGAIKLSHHVCTVCGKYRGVQILKIKQKEEASEEQESAE